MDMGMAGSHWVFPVLGHHRIHQHTSHSNPQQYYEDSSVKGMQEVEIDVNHLRCTSLHLI
jgi:hypothetical protein